MSLTTRFVLTISTIIAFSIGMTVFLETDKYSRTFIQLERSRLAISLREIRDTVEINLNLGMPLGTLQTNRSFLHRIRQSHANVLAIEVFDADGKIQFGTDPSFDGDFVARSWLSATRNAKGEPWLVDDRSADVFAIGMPLLHSHGGLAGGIVLLQDRASMRASVQEVTFRLILAATLTLGIALAVTTGMASVLLRPTREIVVDMAEWVERAAVDGKPPAAKPTLQLQRDCLSFVAAAEAAKADMTATADRIHALDQLDDELPA